MVSYARSTYEKAQKFNSKLEELQKTIKPIIIRTYLAAKNERKEDCVNLNLSEEQKAQLDELEALRTVGIKGEMKYALAQAAKNGIDLSEETVSGKLLVPGFSRDVLQKVPSLGVYDLFLLFTKEELDGYLHSQHAQKEDE